MILAEPVEPENRQQAAVQVKEEELKLKLAEANQLIAEQQQELDRLRGPATDSMGCQSSKATSVSSVDGQTLRAVAPTAPHVPGSTSDAPERKRAIREFLEGVKGGWNDQFGDCLEKLGYEDTDDLVGLPQDEVEDIHAALLTAAGTS